MSKILSNNKYAPGLVTYGVLGGEGSIGLPGKSFYYTSLNKDIEGEYSVIKSKIQNNEILSNNISQSLGDRKYESGDLILDANGNIYQLNLDPSLYDGELLHTLGKINQNEYFYTSGINYNQNNLNKTRIINNGNIYVDYINTSSVDKKEPIEYITGNNISVNSKSLQLTDFAHINYNDVIVGGTIYPFELYTTGKNDNGNLSLVYDKNANGFVYSSDSYVVFDANNVLLTNNNIIFDISNGYGNALTTNDIRSINLFNSQMNELTTSNFNVTKVGDSNSITVTYNFTGLFKNINNLADISNNNIIANLNIIKNNKQDGTSISLGADTLNNIVIRNIKTDSNDNVTITVNNLTEETEYYVYLSLIQNGWEVNLPGQNISTGAYVIPAITWNSESSYIIPVEGVNGKEISATFTANIGDLSTDNLLLETQVNGYPTSLNYIDASIYEIDNTEHIIKVRFTCNSNIDPFVSTNARNFSFVLRTIELENNISSFPINFTQSGQPATGLFDSKWNISNIDSSIILPFVFNVTYDYESDYSDKINTSFRIPFDCSIDWGDGTVTSVIYDPKNPPKEVLDSGNNIDETKFKAYYLPKYSHKYTNAGLYNIKIGGNRIGGWSFRQNRDSQSSANYLISVNDWRMNKGFAYVKGMFYNCKSLSSIPSYSIPINPSLNYDATSISDPSLNAPRSLSYMFYGCSSFNKTNLSTLLETNDASLVEYTSYMFANSGIALTESNLYSFMDKLKSVKYADSMFDSCNNLTLSGDYLYFPRLVPNSNSLNSISRMYAMCDNITGKLYTAEGSSYQLTNKYYLKSADYVFSNTNIRGNITKPLFVNCTSLETCQGMFIWTQINSISDSIWKNCTAVYNTSYMFYACQNLTSITGTLFNGTIGYKRGYISTNPSPDTGINYIIIPYPTDSSTGTYPTDTTIYNETYGISQVCNTRKMFGLCEKLVEVGVNLIERMPYLGRRCKIFRIESDPLYGTEAGDGTVEGDITNMFGACSAMTTIPKSGTSGLSFNTYNYWELNGIDNRYCQIFTPNGIDLQMRPSVFVSCNKLNGYGNIPQAWKAIWEYT